MKKLLESWKKFLTEEKQTIKTKAELISLLKKDPDQKIFLDSPKGATKKFGGSDPIELPFDYGEYPDIINPADNMGWDLIIVPSATKDDQLLMPVGHVEYSKERRDKEGNDNADELAVKGRKININNKAPEKAQKRRRTVAMIFQKTRSICS